MHIDLEFIIFLKLLEAILLKKETKLLRSYIGFSIELKKYGLSRILLPGIYDLSMAEYLKDLKVKRGSNLLSSHMKFHSYKDKSIILMISATLSLNLPHLKVKIKKRKFADFYWKLRKCMKQSNIFWTSQEG